MGATLDRLVELNIFLMGCIVVGSKEKKMVTIFLTTKYTACNYIDMSHYHY